MFSCGKRREAKVITAALKAVKEMRPPAPR